MNVKMPAKRGGRRIKELARSEEQISGPYSHDNLSIFLIHWSDARNAPAPAKCGGKASKAPYFTLRPAMEPEKNGRHGAGRAIYRQHGVVRKELVPLFQRISEGINRSADANAIEGRNRSRWGRLSGPRQPTPTSECARGCS